MTNFNVTIHMGNDAMLSGWHVADALAGVAEQVRESDLPLSERGRIYDINGNDVGWWAVQGSSDAVVPS